LVVVFGRWNKGRRELAEVDIEDEANAELGRVDGRAGRWVTGVGWEAFRGGESAK